ncbi:MAG: hypothetical protein MI743_02215 [Sneathiellales bacterium]|nr:hypothetical protein [Sneathiellales bacterium]
MENTVKTDLDAQLVTMDGLDLANRIRTKELSSIEVLETTIRRIERINPEINAIASTNYGFARKRAGQESLEGIFAGVPTLLKDVFSYPGHTVGFGSRLFDCLPAPAGSRYADAIDKAGLVVLGKSTTSEFGLLGTTETLVKGATKNPWNKSKSAGGSSGGAVAAVAAGLVPVAHASDGGGSVRGPSSFCGLFGFKPSRGRLLDNGLPASLPLSSMISEHCVSRSVRDSAAWLLATEKENTHDPLSISDIEATHPPKKLRIGFYIRDSLGREPTIDARSAVLETASLCESLGHDVYEIDPPKFDAKATAEAFFTLGGVGMAAMFSQFKGMMGPAFTEEGFEPYTRAIAEKGAQTDPKSMGEIMALMKTAEQDLNEAQKQCDIMLSPTVPYPAFDLRTYHSDLPMEELNAFIERVACYTVLPSIAGSCAMSVPLSQTDTNLPMGSHFSAPQGHDRLLFSLAFQLEQASPWQSRIFDMWERNQWYKP